METDKRVADILQGAERALVALSAEAAAARDYEGAGHVLALAGRVADLGRTAPDHGAPAAEGPSGRGPVGPVDPNLASGARRPRSGMMGGTAATGGRRGAANAEYPHFHREADALVKIGWSKSDRSTYEHRSPRAVLDRLAGVIADVGGGGHRFTTDDVLAKGADRLGEVPSYQVYLCLAFIVRQGLVERHGRQGYTILEPGAFASAVNEAWSALPKR